MPRHKTAEHRRLEDSETRKADWKSWGPYLSDRAWGTVREDYSADGEAWFYFPHDHARSRAYRWNEDGLGGFCNRFQNVCLSVALWNGHDAILKERLFGLSGPEGNHGEDVKEYYFYLDGTPTHSYMKMLYKYPHVAFPYARLIEESKQRGKFDGEFELIDALYDEFEQNRYFDVFIEYARAEENDILCRITAINRGHEAAELHILPHIWFRNTWSWGYDGPKPRLRAASENSMIMHERHLGEWMWWIQAAGATPQLLFTENDTNTARLFNHPNHSPFVKDSINDAIVQGDMSRVNPAQMGTKAAAHVKTTLPAGGTFIVDVRFANVQHKKPFANFDKVLQQRIHEADEFYKAIQGQHLSDDERNVQRQALAGLLWSKQFYHYSIQLWQDGDPAQPKPPDTRARNKGWEHVYTLDVLSMPDKWEYPWFAAWDLAFHMIPMAMLDPEWAKRQLILILREWYMHPNGQIPAYEWNFEDVNPPVHAWAAWQVYQISREQTGHADTTFLERIFHKLMLNFTWWVNRKDVEGNNVFSGGFLGLDNIGIFDRSKPLPAGGQLEQADGTAWMAMYCLNMLVIALELAKTKPVYEDVATKFFEHFIYIANAFYGSGSHESLWDELDGFFYDALNIRGHHIPLKTRSFVGLIPLLATQALSPDLLNRLPRFKQRMQWFIKYRPHWIQNLGSLTETGADGEFQLAIMGREKLARVLAHIFDPNEFLSAYGLRSLSKYHERNPYTFDMNGDHYSVSYEPAESRSFLFGGNSNWRGPIWFPINYLIVEALRKYHTHYGDEFMVEFPTGSGMHVTLKQAADLLARRLVGIFLRENDGTRPVFGGNAVFNHHAHWKDYVPFYEYFHGDNGAGLGASHQTGWTSLVANLMQEGK